MKERFRLVLLSIMALLAWASAHAITLNIGDSYVLNFDPPIPSNGWLDRADWTTDKNGLLLYEPGYWGVMLIADTYWEGTAQVTVSYSYSYPVGTKIQVGHGEKTWFVDCIGIQATLNESYIELDVGETATLRFSLASGSMGNHSAEWTSERYSIADVESTGKYTATVRAIGSGTTLITLDPKVGPKVFCNVKVRSYPPTAMSIQPQNPEVRVGKTKQLKAALTPNGATASVKWSTSDQSVATVSNSGLVKGLKEGVVTISAETDNGLYDKTTVTVIPNHPEELTVSPDNITLEQGKQIALTAKITPSDADGSLTWESNNTAVATVDSKGLVTAVGVGKARITATTVNNLKSMCSVTVVEARHPRGPVSASLQGSGTEDDPYLVTCAADLRYIADVSNAGEKFEGKYFLQTEDIVINDCNLYNRGDDFDSFGLELWQPIAFKENCTFNGNYNGGNHRIMGIYIDTEEDPELYPNGSVGGVFGTIEKASISNIEVCNSYIRGVYVGGIIRRSIDGTSNETRCRIYNCHVYDTYLEGKYFGGIIELAYCNIDHCSNYSIMTGKSKSKIGGIAYCNRYQMSNCYNAANINSTSIYAGGMSAFTWRVVTIQNCLNVGEISGDEAGGITGSTDGESTPTIYTCVNLGKIEGKFAGAMIGVLMKGGTYLKYNRYLKSSNPNLYGIQYSSNKLTKTENLACTEAEMKSMEVVDFLNSKKEATDDLWVQDDNGYPILSWVYEWQKCHVLGADYGHSGIVDIEIQDQESALDNYEPVYYNLQGIQVSNPIHGHIYIRTRGSVADKIVY